jgi:hypothetical protein
MLVVFSRSQALGFNVFSNGQKTVLRGCFAKCIKQFVPFLELIAAECFF